MRKRAFNTIPAFTLIELLVVIVIISVAAAVLVRYYSVYNRGIAPGVQCVNNLKQIGLGLYLYAGDNNDKLPWEVPVTNGGTMEFASDGAVYRHLQAMSNELNTPKIVFCPAERRRELATNFATLRDENVSYFISLEPALANPNIIRAGDRNLEVGKRPVKPGLFPLTTNVSVGWTKDLHSRQQKQRCGNVLFSSRHAEMIWGTLDPFVWRQGVMTNVLAVP